ncbi:MAG: RluA family pseudouridine synthase [Clostridia bacterium]|nr:RluA family pseudouridine synthase [Clostridia bacterium]
MISFVATESGKISKIIEKAKIGVSYSAVFKLLRNKDIKVNGTRINKDVAVLKGDKIDIYYNQQKKELFSVVYKDDNVLVINKSSGALSEDVFNEIKENNKNARYIHRLDRNTSGIMIFALNGESEKELLEGFKKRTFDKKYRATTYGYFDKKEGILTAYLKKIEKDAFVKISDKFIDGYSEIKTGYKVEKEYEENGVPVSVITVSLYTGKTHQIRAHLSHIGHFIIGDEKYGDSKINKLFKLKRQNLCAFSLTLFFDKSSYLYYLDGKTFCLGE